MPITVPSFSLRPTPPALTLPPAVRPASISRRAERGGPVSLDAAAAGGYTMPTNRAAPPPLTPPGEEKAGAVSTPLAAEAAPTGAGGALSRMRSGEGIVPPQFRGMLTDVASGMQQVNQSPSRFGAFATGFAGAVTAGSARRSAEENARAEQERARLNAQIEADRLAYERRWDEDERRYSRGRDEITDARNAEADRRTAQTSELGNLRTATEIRQMLDREETLSIDDRQQVEDYMLRWGNQWLERRGIVNGASLREEEEAEFEAAKEAERARYLGVLLGPSGPENPDQKPGAVNTPTATGFTGTGTADDPFTNLTQQVYDNLPVGAYFMFPDPETGELRLMRVKR